MSRQALIIAGAAGPHEGVSALLGRFGFSDIKETVGVNDGLDRIASQHFDLVIMPIQQLDGIQLAALERSLRKAHGTFVIGTAPSADTEMILRAMRTGMHEFLVFPPDPKELGSAVDRLMRRSSSDLQRGSVFAVYSSKGGMGTTSVAVNLAHALAAESAHDRVALADLVVTGGDVRVFLNLEPAYDMTHLAEKLDRVDRELLHSLLTKSTGGVWALTGPDNPEAEDAIDGPTTSNIIEQLRSYYAYTVLDCEHHMSERTLAAMDAADRIVLVTQLSVPGLRSAQRSLALCRRLGYPEDKLAVVVNRYQTTDVLSPADAAAALKCEIFWKLPNDYRGSGLALTKGVPVTEVDAAAKLATSYAQLASKLTGGAAAQSKNGRPSESPIRRLFGVRRR